MAASASCSSFSDSCASCSAQRPLRRRLRRQLDLLRRARPPDRASAPLAKYEPLERVERRAVVVVEREHVAPGARWPAPARRAPPRTARRRGRRAASARRDRSTAPPRFSRTCTSSSLRLSSAEQPLERLVGVDGVVAHADDLAPALDRRGAIAELLLVDLGDARIDARLQIVVVESATAFSSTSTSSLPHAEHVRQAAQLVEQLGLALGGVGLARLFAPGARQRVERQPHVAAALLVQARDLAQQLDAPRLVVDELELGVVDDHQLLPRVLLAVDRLQDLRDAEGVIVVDDQPLERAHRLGMRVGAAEHLFVGVDGGRQVARARSRRCAPRRSLSAIHDGPPSSTRSRRRMRSSTRSCQRVPRCRADRARAMARSSSASRSRIAR